VSFNTEDTEAHRGTQRKPVTISDGTRKLAAQHPRWTSRSSVSSVFKSTARAAAVVMMVRAGGIPHGFASCDDKASFPRAALVPPD